MDKWELARYLIDAKKCVDSVLYISEYAEQLRFYDLKELIDGKRNTFYINCCAVLDKTIMPRNREEKKALFRSDDVVDLLFNERDKNSAHKDDDYKPQPFDKIDSIAVQMKKQIIHVREICKEHLPQGLTLDFVPHDKALFRAVHKLLAEDEERILQEKYLNYSATISENAGVKMVPILQDTLDLRIIPDESRKDYGILIKNGINYYEGIQERQDACIKNNLLHKLDTWCSINQNEIDRHIRLVKLGAYDEFDREQPLPDDPIIANLILKQLNER